MRPVNHVLYLFSSGICTANICRGSTHWTTQPCLSLTLAVSTFRKVLGMRLHSTALMVCTSRRGGHWGTGFLCSLLKMADDRGMAFYENKKTQEYKGKNLKYVPQPRTTLFCCHHTSTGYSTILSNCILIFSSLLLCPCCLECMESLNETV